MENPRIDLVLPQLRCPVCAAALQRTDRSVRCAGGHGFDLARQGYLTLLGGGSRAGQGDTADMVAAREAFLGRGHYAPIAAALAETATTVPAADDDGDTPLVLDLAGGTGFYLAAVLDALPAAVGLDVELSPYAARRAARAHPRLAAVRADVWQRLPLATGSAAAVLSVFGPRNAPEIARVLAPGGRLVVVAPSQDHLAEIIGPLGMIGVAPDKADRLARQLADFAVVEERAVRYRAAMTREDVTLEALMGPSAHHVDRDALTAAALALPDAVDVTVSVTVATYRPLR
ncbi:23S rRNA m(1)G-748 methyltransferase [Georgenia satyanarayanai]|uniref:23S rRNA m(1)G-748 methyltransferase n=1 Tax=Georgenia satyanarayanai TaxID=860221 RepID=A0A2Y9A000_9MICO|nr:methyltransferase domain-containing protein [Georgenia satyanarayanai]PYG02057.1 23S rRNA m(1)G-748 methyltransferase [Georgenia satyanarayanai]SSA36868.1 23S rRNA m(1)G-748 methyltransferase [Georgenia satyanarayanai]